MAGNRVLRWTAGHDPELPRHYGREVRGDRHPPDTFARKVIMFPSRALNRLGVHLTLTLSRLASAFKVEWKIVDQFHILYWSNGWKTWRNTFFLGASACKCPLDLWIYQEMIYELRPDVIVECGTSLGGSAFFLAVMCELVNHGTVVTIDTVPQQEIPQHPRLHYLTGSSTSEVIVKEVKRIVGDQHKVMVILDSDHHKEHVLKELRLYSELISIGSYLIVEDTCLNGHPLRSEFGPGPLEAVQEFLEENPDFVIDKSREKFYLTFNRDGYLKRVGRRALRAEAAAGAAVDGEGAAHHPSGEEREAAAPGGIGGVARRGE